MKKIIAIIPLLLILLMVSCKTNKDVTSASHRDFASLKDILQHIADESCGSVGIAFISDNDTIAVNNHTTYPLMSVFKLHQAIATCQYLADNNIDIDTIVDIPRSSLSEDTWSPMLKENDGDTLKISYRKLLLYTLQQSDNNASNYLFKTTVDPKQTDMYVGALIPRDSFRIIYSEEDMSRDHSLAFENKSSPMGAAILINRLYTDSIFLALPHSDFIRQSLRECNTGYDRIVAPFNAKPQIIVGHKTGSGFRDNGLLSAHNDVAFISLPDGRHYSLAVFITAFPGTEAEASGLIATISHIVYEALVAN